MEFLLKQDEPEGVIPWIKEHARQIQRILVPIFLGSVILYSMGYALKGRWPNPNEIKSALHKDPIQKNIKNGEIFSFSYRKKKYKVRKVAKYELWGLVVSHNNINSFWDAYHDKDSLDTKDLCVLWGKNLKSKDFHRVKVWSGSWTCYFRYPGGIQFYKHELSNNHLITNNEAIRAKIANVRIGDQVHLSGYLVNYKRDEPRWRWRMSSTSRMDTGNTACEVIFVDKLKVLSKGTPIWYFFAGFFFWVWVIALVLIIAVFVIQGNQFPKNDGGDDSGHQAMYRNAR